MNSIVIDIYGADAGIDPVVRGTAAALRGGREFFPVLVGDEKSIRDIMDAEGVAPESYDVIHTDKYFTNSDLPTAIYGAGDDTSMAMAYEYLKSTPDCVGLLSAGSTGILLVGAMCRLGLMPGIRFPVLSSALPCVGADKPLLCLVDCGANTDCTPKDLVRFGIMGSVFSRSMCGIERPRVGIMSVGRESGKGNELTKKAYPLMCDADINFIGNVEGSDMVSGYADVVVCDGFCGNILLKAVEAVGKAAMETVCGVCDDKELAARINTALYKRFDFNSQGAATFLGTEKIVVKMHGIANCDTVVASIDQLLRLHNAGFIEEMKNILST